ncbi:DUF5718 family protein [Miltoncostaea oceani]|uniref:DUF5718 family protein n=1 Tax=Miltoncostaea oceani TaxID=2843216 RepID=UPI001C3C7BE1|nr:DUF5718 family protein [Miltoncostaea oceani]
MIELRLDDLREAFGFGVAGNFAGHLEQAGEAADFAGVATGAGEAPKGIFPWYVPGADTFLGVFPLSHDRLVRPAAEDGPVNLQIEPEVGLLCDVVYAPDGGVETLVPRALGAFDDCSIRRPGAPKISHKKNWGRDSKGVARRMFPVTDLSPDGPTAGFRLASFLRRDGVAHDYGIDSPLPGYSYYGETLLAWMAERLRAQAGSPDTPLEPVGEYLAAAGGPATVLIGIGATRYTALGESTYLEPGDEAIVIVYDAAASLPEDVRASVAAGAEDTLARASVLRQRVVSAGG